MVILAPYLLFFMSLSTDCGTLGYMHPDLPSLDVLSLGLVGSKLYGMAGPGSDDDWKGVYRAPIHDVLSNAKVPESFTWSDPDPDCTLFEVGKFFQLASKSNPTAIELLYLPSLVRSSPEWDLILANRELFLSDMARQSYGGFGKKQKKQLEEGVRRSKSIRHMFRIVEQGIELLTTGTMNPVVRDPERLMALGEMSDDELAPLIHSAFAELASCDSVLPAADEVDQGAINDLLVQVRLAGL